MAFITYHSTFEKYMPAQQYSLSTVDYIREHDNGWLGTASWQAQNNIVTQLHSTDKGPTRRLAMAPLSWVTLFCPIIPKFSLRLPDLERLEYGVSLCLELP